MISLSLAEARLIATRDWLQRGGQPAYAVLYPAPQPPALEGHHCEALAVVNFQLPLGEIENGALVIKPTSEALVVISGLPVWARIHNGAGEPALDVTVGDEGSDSLLKLNKPAGQSELMLYAGGAVSILSGQLS